MFSALKSTHILYLLYFKRQSYLNKRSVEFRSLPECFRIRWECGAAVTQRESE